MVYDTIMVENLSYRTIYGTGYGRLPEFINEETLIEELARAAWSETTLLYFEIEYSTR